MFVRLIIIMLVLYSGFLFYAGYHIVTKEIRYRMSDPIVQALAGGVLENDNATTYARAVARNILYGND